MRQTLNKTKNTSGMQKLHKEQAYLRLSIKIQRNGRTPMGLKNIVTSALRTGVRALIHKVKIPGTHSSNSRKEITRQAQSTASPTFAGSYHVSAHNNSWYPQPGSPPVEWKVSEHGLPPFDYSPNHDGGPDPGEIAWTWVPYQENNGRGKDRPVIALAMDGDYVIFAQLTSKDHADHRIRKDRYGTWWMDIGSGAWDPQGRASEVKLNILWIVHESHIRRMGSALDAKIYSNVVTAIQKIHTS